MNLPKVLVVIFWQLIKLNFCISVIKLKNILLDRIKSFVINKKRKLFFLFLVMILIQMNNLVMPIFIQQFIDGRDKLSVFSNIAVASIFTVLIFVFTYITENLRGNLINAMQLEFNKRFDLYIYRENSRT